MNVISLKEYARINNVSYEAIRRQVVRYASELEGHVIKDGRQQFLDDEAVAFLDGKRQKNPVVLYQANKDEELDQLRADKAALLEELNLVKNRVIAQQDKLYELAAADQKIQLLEESSRASEERAAQAEADRKQAVETLEVMRREAQYRAEAAVEAEEQRIEAEKRTQAAEERAAELQALLDQIAGSRGMKRRKLLKELRKNKEDV